MVDILFLFFWLFYFIDLLFWNHIWVITNLSPNFFACHSPPSSCIAFKTSIMIKFSNSIILFLGTTSPIPFMITIFAYFTARSNTVTLSTWLDCSTKNILTPIVQRNGETHFFPWNLEFQDCDNTELLYNLYRQISSYSISSIYSLKISSMKSALAGV